MNYEQLETKLLDSIDEPKFAQEFEQKSMFGMDKTTLMRGLGAGVSGTVSGIISSVVPMNFGISGLPTILGGMVLKKFGGGALRDIGEGVLIAGIGQLAAGFIPSVTGALSQPQRPQLESETKVEDTKIAGVAY
tara:strand:+ start:1396 stop:1797 length:402 start_codon:yes stop_codon:yes gene_type:complete